MHKITALFVGLAALAAISTTAATVAEAKGGCGSGMFFDGQRCVPMGGPGYRHEPGHRGAYLNFAPNYRHDRDYDRPYHRDYDRPYHGSPRGGVHLGIGPGLHLHLGGDH
jgi:hypothetical protein